MTDDPFDRSPDIWYEAKQGRFCFWCIDGVWHWRHIDEDFKTVLAEGLGPP